MVPSRMDENFMVAAIDQSAGSVRVKLSVNASLVELLHVFRYIAVYQTVLAFINRLLYTGSHSFEHKMADCRRGVGGTR